MWSSINRLPFLNDKSLKDSNPINVLVFNWTHNLELINRLPYPIGPYPHSDTRSSDQPYSVSPSLFILLYLGLFFYLVGIPCECLPDLSPEGRKLLSSLTLRNTLSLNKVDSDSRSIRRSKTSLKNLGSCFLMDLEIITSRYKFVLS